jgi:hypothetical protein
MTIVLVKNNTKLKEGNKNIILYYAVIIKKHITELFSEL